MYINTEITASSLYSLQPLVLEAVAFNPWWVHLITTQVSKQQLALLLPDFSLLALTFDHSVLKQPLSVSPTSLWAL